MYDLSIFRLELREHVDYGNLRVAMFVVCVSSKM